MKRFACLLLIMLLSMNLIACGETSPAQSGQNSSVSGPAGSPSVPPAKNPPTQAPSAEDPSKDVPSAETPPQDAPPAGNPPQDVPPAETPPQDAPPTANPPQDAPPAENPSQDTPPTGNPPQDAPPAEAPSGEVPTAPSKPDDPAVPARPDPGSGPAPKDTEENTGGAEDGPSENPTDKKPRISLRWHAEFLRDFIGRTYDDISAGGRFGTENGEHTVHVRVNGQRVTGFSILENAAPDTCQLSVSPAGDLVIRVVGPGESKFTIGYQGVTASFTWVAGNGPSAPIPPAQGSHKISLRWYLNGLDNKSSYETVKAGAGLGTGGGTQYMDVLVDGKPVDNFDILSNDDDNVCRLSRSPEGYFVLKVVGPGVSVFTIGHGDSQASFSWDSNGCPILMGGPDEITLLWFCKEDDGTVRERHITPGEGFGDPKRGMQDMVVLVNGQPVTGFTVKGTNPNSPVTVTPEGHIALDNGVGESWLTVTCGDSFALFKWGGAIS